MNSFPQFIGSLIIGLGGGLFALILMWWLVEQIIKRIKAHAAVVDFIFHRQAFKRWFPIRWELQDVFDRAESLEDWLGRNAGDTADYPLRLIVDNPESAAELTARLNFLKDAIKRYREKNPLP